MQVIEEMNEISNLPQDISRLLPWSPKVVEYEESEDNYTNLNSKAVTSDDTEERSRESGHQEHLGFQNTFQRSIRPQKTNFSPLYIA